MPFIRFRACSKAGYTPVAILEEHAIGGFVQQIDYLFAKIEYECFSPF
jgi:hypothetical protein